MLGHHEIVSINPLSRLQKVIKLQGDTIVTSKKKNINITQKILTPTEGTYGLNYSIVNRN